MRPLLTIIMLLAVPLCAQQKTKVSSMAIIERNAEPPAPYDTEPAQIGEGRYVIENVHSGYALGVQSYGKSRLLAQFDTVNETWEFIRASDGKYLIRGTEGFLSESGAGKIGVRVGEDATAWAVSRIDGGDTYEIRGPSGGVLTNLLWRVQSGNWVVMDGRFGGANQEWLIRPRTTVMARQPQAKAYLRSGKRGHRISVHTATVRSSPVSSWSEDGGQYIYRYRITEPALIHLVVGYVEGRDAVGVSAPTGWSFFESGWSTAAPGANGEFAMRSSWAPGPVLVTAIGDSDLFEYDPEHTTHDQYRSAVEAQTNQGSHQWHIGPAIPPGTDADALRKLAQHWVMNGLAFVSPLLDPNKDLSAAIDELNPSSAFERELVRVLRAAVQ